MLNNDFYSKKCKIANLKKQLEEGTNIKKYRIRRGS